MKLWPLQHCRQSEPQCVGPQLTTALAEPPKLTGRPQQLFPKPRRQSAGPLRHPPPRPKDFGKSPTWQPINPATPGKPAPSRHQGFILDQTLRVTSSNVAADGTKQPDPREINDMLVDVSSADHILSIYAQHKEGFNTVNLSTALYRLAKVLLACASHGLHLLNICCTFAVQEPPMR